MPALLSPSVTSARPDLRLARQDITFGNLTPEQVRIEVTVTNAGEAPSSPTVARIEAAPFGAFLPWSPLATLPVPALPPGGSAVLTLDARRVAPALQLDADRTPPRRLLTALGAEDERPGRSRSRAETRAALLNAALPAPPLPTDLFQLLGRQPTHWVGNLNVFVNNIPVERHLAQALRIYPGAQNLAMFVVGSHQKDAYRFWLEGPGARWDARLADGTDVRALLDLPSAAPVDTERWIDAQSMRLMFLMISPPASCEQGHVEVHVEQRSTGRQAVVEFSLDPEAAGAGCYVVG
jgi:hypothetical protein